MRGAGGTSGGLGTFFIGILMMAGGFYLLLSSITVHGGFNLGYSLYHWNAMGSQMSLTSGMVLVPFMFGIGLIFYNGKSIVGWLLAVLSLAALVFGVIASIRMSMRTMSAFDLLVILVLFVGGIGLVLRSLKDHSRN